MSRGHPVKTPERVAEARRLRDDGKTLADIGEVFGVSLKTIHEWLSDPDGTASRARKDSYASTCIDCGAPTSGSEGRRPEPRCYACGNAIAVGKRTIWSRDAIILAIQEWVAEHGEPPAQPDWEPAHARELGDEARGRPCQRPSMRRVVGAPPLRVLERRDRSRRLRATPRARRRRERTPTAFHASKSERRACGCGAMRPLLLTVVVLIAAPAYAGAAPLPTIPSSLQLAGRAFPGGDCTPQSMRVTIGRDLHTLNDAGQPVAADELATGRGFYPDGTSRLVSCEITIDQRVLKTPARMCDVIVHGYGHVSSGLRHTHDGSVMDEGAPAYPPCHARTRREQITDQIRSTLPKGYAWAIHCDKPARRCKARARGARTRAYQITRGQVEYTGLAGQHRPRPGSSFSI